MSLNGTTVIPGLGAASHNCGNAEAGLHGKACGYRWLHMPTLRPAWPGSGVAQQTRNSGAIVRGFFELLRANSIGALLEQRNLYGSSPTCHGLAQVVPEIALRLLAVEAVSVHRVDPRVVSLPAGAESSPPPVADNAHPR